MDWTRWIDPEGLHTWVVRSHEEEVRRAELTRLATNDRTPSWWARVVHVLRSSPAPASRTAPVDP
jgi:hypothetical protein